MRGWCADGTRSMWQWCLVANYSKYLLVKVELVGYLIGGDGNKEKTRSMIVQHDSTDNHSTIPTTTPAIHSYSNRNHFLYYSFLG